MQLVDVVFVIMSWATATNLANVRVLCSSVETLLTCTMRLSC